MYQGKIALYTEKYSLIAILIAFLLLCMFFVLWGTLFVQEDHGMIARSVNIWGDWVVHITQANSFHDWPLGQWLNKNALINDINFRYPPLANVFAGLLMDAGMTLPKAMTLSSFIMSLALVYALFNFYQRFTHSWNWASIGVLLFLFNGGLGFWYTFTQDLESATHLPKHGLVIQNFIISEFVPQRAILFASSFFILSLTILQDMLSNKERKLSTNRLVLFVLFSNIIMLSSMHSYLALIVICTLIGIQTLKMWRQWLYIAIFCGLTNGIVYFLYFGGNSTNGFINFMPMELIKYSKLTAIKFFFVNYGLILPIFIYSYFRYKFWRQPLVTACLGLFFMSYIWKFQPWIWDNTKLLTWAYLIILIPCVKFIQHMWQQDKCCKRMLASLVFLSAVISGGFDVWKIAKPNAHAYTLYGKEEIRLAKSFNKLSKYDDLTLTHMGHENWVHALAARPVYRGFAGWLWTWGLDTNDINRKQDAMFLGNEELIKENNIKYIVIDINHEREKVNLKFFKKYKVILRSDRFKVYKTGY